MTSYTLTDQLFASPVDPLALSDVNVRVHLVSESLLALAGRSGNWDHWSILRVMANFMEALVSLGYADDPDGLVADADIVLRFAALDASLSSTTPRVGAGAAGVLLALIEDYSECLRNMPARSAIRAMRTTDRAMNGPPKWRK